MSADHDEKHGGTIGFYSDGAQWEKFRSLARELKISQSDLAREIYAEGIARAERKLRAEEVKRFEMLKKVHMKATLPTFAFAIPAH